MNELQTRFSLGLIRPRPWTLQVMRWSILACTLIVLSPLVVPALLIIGSCLAVRWALRSTPFSWICDEAPDKK